MAGRSVFASESRRFVSSAIDLVANTSVHIHGFADVDERKRPFMIVFKYPLFRFFKETILFCIFLKAFNRVLQNSEA